MHSVPGFNRICSHSFRSNVCSFKIARVLLPIIAQQSFVLSSFLVFSALAVTGLCTSRAYAGPEGRTRTVCTLYSRACGGHLQPQCTSGDICDAGHRSHTINVSINCPWPIPDTTITAGCYDERPDCSNCSADGQIPCPAAAEPFCDAGCDSGLVTSPITSLCSQAGSSGIPAGDIGAFCGPLVPCKEGLACDETQLKCVGKVGVGQSCLNPFVPCEDGLACSWGVCSHVPGQINDTCDVGNPCGDGLFCQAGIPQRCKALKKVGEGCSVFNPCVDGAFCDACVGEGCNSALQCWPDQQGLFTEETCLPLRSEALHEQIMGDAFSEAHTFGVGNELAAGIGESQEFGVVYGDNARFGCFTTLCAGINIDLGAEAFVSYGLYISPDAVDGNSFTTFQEAQVVGALNYSTTQVFPRGPGELVPNGGLIGTAVAFSLGTPTNPYPVSGGAFVCDTVLQEFPIPIEDRLFIEPITGPGPGTSSPETNSAAYGAIQFNGESNNKVALEENTALIFNERFSVSLWLSPAEENQSATFLSNEGRYQIALINGELSYTIANEEPGWGWVGSGFFPPVDKWTHAVLTYDQSVVDETNLRVYVNGELKHQLDGLGLIADVHPDLNEFQIGGRQQNTGVFNGVLDNVRIWSRALSHDEVRANLHDDLDTDLLTGLITAWNFDETSGNTLISQTNSDFDISLNSVDASMPPVRVDGSRQSFEGALSLDGSSNHTGASMNGSLSNLLGSDQFTFEAWVAPTAPQVSDEAYIFEKGGEFSLFINSENTLVYRLATSTPGWGEVTTTIELSTTEWTHVAVVYGSSQNYFRIYINGEQQYSIEANGVLEDTDITDNAFKVGEEFSGYIDEVRIWSTARSASEILANFDISLSLNDPLPLLAYWKYNENNLLVNLDSSGKHNHSILGTGDIWKSATQVSVLNELSYPSSLLGDACDTVPLPDKDFDGVCDEIDNCPTTENADQLDSNSDGTGDACSETIATPLVNRSALATVDRNVTSGASNVVLHRFNLDSNYASSTLDSITLTGQGSGDESASVSLVKLWQDNNKDGVVDPGDIILGSGVFNTDNVDLVIDLDEVYVLPYGETHFIISYDFY